MAAKVSIPFRREAEDIYVVYFSPAVHSVPEQEGIETAARRWQEGHLEEPLKTAVAAFVERRFISIRVQGVDSLPQLPVELLRRMGLGELEERVVRSARHAVLIMSQDLNIPPRSGLWACLSAALGVAEMLDGVVFDPDALRIVDRQEAPTWFSPMGRISASQHVIVPFSVDESGLGWMTTRGLRKFGLPDLELKEIPPNLPKLGFLLNAVAQLLIQEGFRASMESSGEIKALELDGDVIIGADTYARSRAAQPEEVPGSDIRVALRLNPTSEDVQFVEICRPRDVRTDQSQWLYTVMPKLEKGADDRPTMVATGSDEMAEAHERALAELPAVKRRFLAGLRPGEVLYIKHGFRTRDDGREYMWFAVTRWEGSGISGLLSNEPADVPSLRLGQEVTIPESEVFDWSILLPHGETEGGYTTAVVLKQGKGG